MCNLLCALAVENRGYTDETCFRRFKRFEMTESAAADFVCIAAVSNRQGLSRTLHKV
jgi:hypothetical protein